MYIPININGKIKLPVRKKIKYILIQLVNAVIKKLELKFCSIDIVDIEDSDLKVLKINSGVMMKNFINLHLEGKFLAKKIYYKATTEIFR